MKSHCSFASVTFVILICGGASVLAQGSLTPPGAPAATMRTLLQIEPRTPISGSLTISTPGSYYLTNNITVATGNGITINTSNLTLDLNGFTISSTQNPASGAAIFINAGFSNITIVNGYVNSGVSFSAPGTYSGSGFGYGVTCGGATNNVEVRSLAVFGVLNNGIDLGFGGTIVRECSVVTAGAYGIYADSVSNSAARNTGNSGFLANNALNCTGSSNLNHGVQATTATNCVGTAAGASNTGNGISANTALNCYGTATGGRGVSADTASNCEGTAANGNGIYANVANSCIGTSSTGTAVVAVYRATDCYGTSAGYGVDAPEATNCYGVSTGGGWGVHATFATGCHGESATSIGLGADVMANGCYGETAGHNAYGIQASVAIDCYGQYDGDGGSPVAYAINASKEAIGCYSFNSHNNTFGILTNVANACVGGGVNAPNKFNMPP